MAVPFIDLQRFEPGFLDRWAEICGHLTRDTQFVGGPAVGRFEETLAASCQVAAAVGCANGTDALQLALRAVGVGAGDLVLIPDATFWASFEAVVNCGARPVTVDVDAGDLQMDYDRFRAAVERFRPRAAMLVHLYGWGSARLGELRDECRRLDLPLVEDGAQAFAVEWRGEPIMKGAEMFTLSFYPAKVLGACGDAGAVLCADAAVAERVRRLGNHGRTGHYQHGVVGWNSRLGGFDAAYLGLSLEFMPERLASRRRAAARYRRLLAEIGVAAVGPPAGYLENGYLNVTLHPPAERPGIEAELRRRGIGFGNVYPGAMSKQPGAASHLAGSVGGDNADRLCRSVLNLPLFAYITDGEIDEVVAAMARATSTES